MTQSTTVHLVNRIKRHQNHLVRMKADKEKGNQSSQAIMEHLKLVQKALQKLGETGSQGAQVDVRVLTATFDNIKI